MVFEDLHYILTLNQLLVTAWEQRKCWEQCSQDLSHRQTCWLWVPLLPNKVYLYISLEMALFSLRNQVLSDNNYMKMWELNIALLYIWQSRKSRAPGTLLSKWKEMELAIRIEWAFPSLLNPLFQSSVRGSWATPTVLHSRNGYLSCRFELFRTVR